MARCYRMAGGVPGDAVQITPLFGLFNGGFGMYHGARAAGLFVIPAGPGNTQRQVKLARDLRTRILTGVVSYGIRIIEVMEEMGEKLPDLEVGIFGAEAFSESMSAWPAAYRMAGGVPGDAVQITPLFGLFNGGFGMYHGARAAGLFVIPAGPGNTQRQVKLARDLRTRILTGVVSYGIRIIEVMEEMGEKLPDLEVGIFGAEAFSESMSAWPDRAGGVPGDAVQITPLFGLFNGGFGMYHGASCRGAVRHSRRPGNTQRQVKLAGI